MIKILCDRCGTDITTSGFFGNLKLDVHKSPDYTDAPESYLDVGKEHRHFCRECIDAICEFALTEVGAAAQEEAAETTPPDSPAEPKKKARRKVDIGKIMALKNAGWDNGKIAEEMHLTKASVATMISKYRKGKGAQPDEEESGQDVHDDQGAV